MKRNSIRVLPNSIFAVFLAFLLMLPFFPLSASASECTDQPEPVSFSFLNTGNTADISAVCYYSDEYFYQPGTIADSHLRTMSLAMSMSAFESFREGEDYTDRCENFEQLMSRIGFFDFSHNDAFDEKPTEESIGIILARKKIDVFGTEYDLIAVGIRGASYEAEWANNMRIGPTGQAEGFSAAKDQVLDYLREYESVRNIKDHAKIWIAGYSRAGAVSNLTAQSLNQDPSSFATAPEDIYCYTFEAPPGEETSAAGQYRNIHNTVSPADPVPLIPLSEWGLTRVGWTQEGQLECYSQDDCLLPAPGSEEYSALKETLLAHLGKINPYIVYSIDDFSEARLDIWNLPPDVQPSQSDFLQSFTAWLNSTLPDKSRVSYAENYQDAFSTMGRLFPSIWGSQKEQITAALDSAVKDPLFYASVAEAVLVIPLRNVMDVESYQSAIKKASDSIAENLIGHMKDENVGFSEEEYQEFADALYPIILFTDDALEDDISHHGGYHLATLLTNTQTLVQAHNPEVILAWMETFDSYYTPSLYTPHQLEHIEFTNATCTRDGHEEYWKCTACGVSYADPGASRKISEKDVLIPATGHDWDNGVISKAATIKSNGIRTFTCKTCGKTRTESIAKLPSPSPKPTQAITAQESGSRLSYTQKTTSADESAASSDRSAAGHKGILFMIITAIIAVVLVAAVFLFLSEKKKKKRDDPEQKS